MSISPGQVAAARKLVRWTQLQLEYEASVGEGTVAHFETGKLMPSDRMISAIKSALEDAGIEFATGRKSVSLRKENSGL